MSVYPVPFRRLEEKEQYRKFDWLECHLARNPADPRPETYRPVDERELHPVGHIDTSDDWQERRRLVLNTARVYNRLDDLIAGAKSNQLSLAVFKPARILDFFWETEERAWDPDKLRQMREANRQYDLFEDNAWRETFKIIAKLPYSFSYRFEDAAGRRSEMQILDWEAGALFWNCLRSVGGDEPGALAKVRRKYFDEFLERDLHFFLGTTQQFHFVAPNPWVIIGVFPIPYKKQLTLW
ncbi:MAG: hypothetical protein R3B70_37690 [Polyangiaceae bacterium]